MSTHGGKHKSAPLSTFTFSDSDNNVDDVYDEKDDNSNEQLMSRPTSSHDQCVTLELEDDPAALWSKHLTDKERCSIVQRGPVQSKDDRIYPKNQEGRRFTSRNYYLQMKNGEKMIGLISVCVFVCVCVCVCV